MGRIAALVLLATLTLASVACGSGDTDGAVATSELAEIDVDAFEQRLDESGDQRVVNVHIPYEGEIAGTDLFIPFDEIVDHPDHPDLPDDRDARLLLYCRSGNMSRQAGEALAAAGYTDVTHLDGGMVAWQEAGNELMTAPD